MWKVSVLAAAVFCLSLLGLLLGHRVLTASASAVILMETESAGDPAAAEGLRLSLSYRTKHSGTLLWTTELDPAAGPESAATIWDFDPGGHKAVWREGVPSGLDLSCDLYLSSAFHPGVTEEELAGADPGRDFQFGRLLAAAAAETPAGAERSVTLAVRDYYEFYPFRAGFSPGGRVSGSWEQENAEKVRAFFRIPVPADLRVEVRVKKSAGGLITELECGAAGTERESPDPLPGALMMAGAATADTCYFTFDNSGVLSGPFDTSRIPGGYGVYALPYTRNSQGVAEADGDGLYLARPLDPAETVLNMSLDGLGRVLLFTWKEGTLYLNVYLPDEHLTEVQRVVLGSMPEAGSPGLLRLDADRALCLDQWDRLVVAELDENERWVPALELSVPERPELEGLYYGLDYAWDGGRLAVAYALRDEDFFDRGVGVTVYGAEGQLYTGFWRSSLTDPVPASYSARLSGNGPWPVSLRWERNEGPAD